MNNLAMLSGNQARSPLISSPGDTPSADPFVWVSSQYSKPLNVEGIVSCMVAAVLYFILL